MDKEKISVHIEDRMVEGKYDEAYPLLLELAYTYNDPEAFEGLGDWYYSKCLKTGINYKKAFQFFLQACKAGTKPGVIISLVMEKYDESVKRDVDAKEGYRHLLDYLMEQEWTDAYIFAGDEYLGYEDVYEHDTEKGIACYEKAIELGEGYGYDCLGEAYFTGTVGKVDYKKAFEYFTATDEVHSDGKYYYLGEMYFHGYYVEKDWSKAKEYYEGLLRNELYKDSDSMYVPMAKKRLLEMEE